ncbi:hypothetical protein [Aromatoleum sp.]|uniref:hypothetical protein n=1 Tax=Aromatoleum sp. TaxID=2307007 RepID=UPI002FC9D418
MKSALFALGALALGASAYYYLDPKRARVPAGGSRRGSWRPPALGANEANVEPGEIEEIAGSPAIAPTARTASSEFAPGTSGLSTPGAPTSGTGAYGLAASEPGHAPSGGGFSTPPQSR